MLNFSLYHAFFSEFIAYLFFSFVPLPFSPNPKIGLPVSSPLILAKVGFPFDTPFLYLSAAITASISKFFFSFFFSSNPLLIRTAVCLVQGEGDLFDLTNESFCRPKAPPKTALVQCLEGASIVLVASRSDHTYISTLFLATFPRYYLLSYYFALILSPKISFRVYVSAATAASETEWLQFPEYISIER